MLTDLGERGGAMLTIGSRLPSLLSAKKVAVAVLLRAHPCCPMVVLLRAHPRGQAEHHLSDLAARLSLPDLALRAPSPSPDPAAPAPSLT
jgi:hypothetical protein